MLAEYFPECQHKKTAVRWRIRSNQTGYWAEQCLTCGRQMRVLRKDAPEVQGQEQVPFDFALEEAYGRLRQDFYDQKREEENQKREEARLAWWAQYNAYLESPAWKSRRKRVLERDDHICQACLLRTATQVHHLTYAHVFREPLFDLIAVCESCHYSLHQQQTP
jgi:5-methylcytosine-specific restriction endonuclease McrA